MCCIAYQPPGDESLPTAQLDNMWAENQDGAGYMFAVGGKLIVRKPFFKLSEMKKAYADDHTAHGAASSFVLHFRWSTHGKKDELNTHPHILCGGRAALVHNGVLHDFAPAWNSDISDTVAFCHTVLAFRQPSLLTGRKFGKWLRELIGANNKLVLMDYKGNVSIVNAEAGIWDGDRWYSNAGYKGRRKRSLPPQSCGYTCGAGYPGSNALPVRYQEELLWGADAADDYQSYAYAKEKAQGAAAQGEDDATKWRAHDEERAAEDGALDALEELYDHYFDALVDACKAAGRNIPWDQIEDEAWDLAAEELRKLDTDSWALAKAAMEREA